MEPVHDQLVAPRRDWITRYDEAPRHRITRVAEAIDLFSDGLMRRWRWLLRDVLLGLAAQSRRAGEQPLASRVPQPKPRPD